MDTIVKGNTDFGYTTTGMDAPVQDEGHKVRKERRMKNSSWSGHRTRTQRPWVEAEPLHQAQRRDVKRGSEEKAETPGVDLRRGLHGRVDNRTRRQEVWTNQSLIERQRRQGFIVNNSSPVRKEHRLMSRANLYGFPTQRSDSVTDLRERDITTTYSKRPHNKSGQGLVSVRRFSNGVIGLTGRRVRKDDNRGGVEDELSLSETSYPPYREAQKTVPITIRTVRPTRMAYDDERYHPLDSCWAPRKSRQQDTSRSRNGEATRRDLLQPSVKQY